MNILTALIAAAIAAVAAFCIYAPIPTAVIRCANYFKMKKNGRAGKVIFLTFDDGPSREYTPELLELLSKYEVKATFFYRGGFREREPGHHRADEEGRSRRRPPFA